MQDNHYAILGLSPKADTSEIKAAYRKLAMRYHPDRNGNSEQAEEHFKKVSLAYMILSDPTKRLAYDMGLVANVYEPPHRDPAYRPRSRETYHRPQQKPPETTGYKSLTTIWALTIGFFILIVMIFAGLVKYRINKDYEQAYKLRAEGKPYKALELMEHSAAYQLTLPSAYYLLGAEIYLYNLEQYEEAGEMALKGLNASPGNEERYMLHFIRGKYKMYSSNNRQAYESFEQSYDGGKGLDSALYAMAELEIISFGLYNKGLASCDKLISSAPGFHHAYFLKAYAAYQIGEYEAAEQHIETFLNKMPELGIGQILAAKIYLETEPESNRACEALNKAAKLGYAVQPATLAEMCNEA